MTYDVEKNTTISHHGNSLEDKWLSSDSQQVICQGCCQSGVSFVTGTRGKLTDNAQLDPVFVHKSFVDHV